MSFSERSAATRAAILEAAMKCFATEGYDKATIRAIAAEAGVTAAMVIRYYGSKAELFALTVKASYTFVDPKDAPWPELGRLLIRGAFEAWESGENAAIAAVYRAAPTHPEAARVVQRIVEQQVIPTFKAALPDDPDVELRAGLAHAIGVGAFTTRYLLRLEPLVSMDFDEFTDSIGDMIQHVLTRPMRP